MFRKLKVFLLGDPKLKRGAVDDIPRSARKAHHDFMNTAMAVQVVTNRMKRDADYLIEVLARDLQERRIEKEQ